MGQWKNWANTGRDSVIQVHKKTDALWFTDFLQIYITREVLFTLKLISISYIYLRSTIGRLKVNFFVNTKSILNKVLVVLEKIGDYEKSGEISEDLFNAGVSVVYASVNFSKPVE